VRRMFEPTPLLQAWKSLGPEWDGHNKPGMALTVVLEQGFGDVFQFLRYVPRLIELGIKVTVWGHQFYDPILPLIRIQDWGHRVCGPGDPNPASAPWVALMDLPGYLDLSTYRRPNTSPVGATPTPWRTTPRLPVCGELGYYSPAWQPTR
jgi:hypothetical protein